MTSNDKTDRTAVRGSDASRHKRASALLLAATAMATLSACSTTHLTGHPVTPPSAVQPRAGMGYALPATVFDITVTRKLAACEGATKIQPGFVKFNTDATVVAQQIAGDQFQLDHRSLASSLKTSTLKLETYPNGTLKSVNAAVTDHGPEVATSVLKSVAGVARIALGLPPGGGVPGDKAAAEPPQLKCSKAATDALAAVTAAKTAVQQQTAALEVTTETITSYNARRAIGTLVRADFAKLNAAMALSAKQAAALTEAKTALDKAVAAVTATESFSWPSSAGRSEAVIHASAPVEQKLTKFVSGQWSLQDNLSIVVALRPASGRSAGMPAEPSPLPPLPAAGGIYYRMPGSGRMQICAPKMEYRAVDDAGRARETQLLAQSPRPSDAFIAAEVAKARTAVAAELEAGAVGACSSADRSTLLVDQLITVPQFGQLYVLALHNGWGQDNVLTGTWRADGSPESISYDEKKATAVAMAGLVETAVTATGAIYKDLRASSDAEKAAALADKAATQKAELDTLSYQTDLLKKQKEQIDLRGALARSGDVEAGAAELASINAETALVNASKARLQAQIDYKALQAKAIEP